MPELPEVERGRRIAERAAAGKRIVSVFAAADPIVFHGVTPRRFVAALGGRRIMAARRRGKHLWFELDQRPWPTFHFGMTGAFHAYANPAARPRFTKCELELEDGVRLAMTNARRLGRIRLQDDPPDQPPISTLGFDPLLDLPSGEAFVALLLSRKGPLKAVLLDQTFAAGVGNWIADEVLYQARLDPRRRAYDLSRAEALRLRTKLRSVIRLAVDADADDRLFPKSWLFHHRWGRNSDARTWRGQRVEHLTLAGRTTAWVPAVQR